MENSEIQKAFEAIEALLALSEVVREERNESALQNGVFAYRTYDGDIVEEAENV